MRRKCHSQTTHTTTHRRVQTEESEKENRCESLQTHMCVFWWVLVNNIFFKFLQFDEIMCYSQDIIRNDY